MRKVKPAKKPRKPRPVCDHEPEMLGSLCRCRKCKTGLPLSAMRHLRSVLMERQIREAERGQPRPAKAPATGVNAWCIRDWKGKVVELDLEPGAACDAGTWIPATGYRFVADEAVDMILRRIAVWKRTGLEGSAAVLAEALLTLGLEPKP